MNVQTDYYRMSKLFVILLLLSRLNVLHNYFDGPIKLFSNLYVAKIFQRIRSFHV